MSEVNEERRQSPPGPLKPPSCTCVFKMIKGPPDGMLEPYPGNDKCPVHSPLLEQQRQRRAEQARQEGNPSSHDDNS